MNNKPALMDYKHCLFFIAWIMIKSTAFNIIEPNLLATRFQREPNYFGFMCVLLSLRLFIV